jgi:hypothetical protein
MMDTSGGSSVRKVGKKAGRVDIELVLVRVNVLHKSRDVVLQGRLGSCRDDHRMGRPGVLHIELIERTVLDQQSSVTASG